MKFTASLLCAVLLALCLPIPAISSVMMVDPFVGMEFDPSTPSYEVVPRADHEKMDLRDGPWWVFARYKRSDGGVYLVVSGLVRNEFDTTPPTYSDQEPDFGVVLLLNDGKYKTLGVPDRIDEEELGLGDAAIRGLMDDFAARLIAAFGSKRRIEELLDQNGHHPWMLKVVAEGLTRAGIRVPPEMVMHGPYLPWLDKPVSK